MENSSSGNGAKYKLVLIEDHPVVVSGLIVKIFSPEKLKRESLKRPEESPTPSIVSSQLVLTFRPPLSLQWGRFLKQLFPQPIRH